MTSSTLHQPPYVTTLLHVIIIIIINTGRHALKRLSRRNDIVIKSADKGSGTVVMDRNWYIDECLRQLNDSKFYKTLDKDITTDIQKRVQIYVQRMHRDQIIDDHTKRFLLQTDPKPGRFYILPKIHKQGNPGRPIVSSNSHPTERISQFVDYHLKPLVQTTQSFIKDTTHFLNKLQQLGQLPNNAILLFSTSLLSTLTYLITKALTRVDISSTHVTAPLLPSVPKLYVTSYA